MAPRQAKVNDERDAISHLFGPDHLQPGSPRVGSAKLRDSRQGACGDNEIIQVGAMPPWAGERVASAMKCVGH